MHGDKIFGVGKFHILSTEDRFVAAKMPQIGRCVFCDKTLVCVPSYICVCVYTRKCDCCEHQAAGDWDP